MNIASEPWPQRFHRELARIAGLHAGWDGSEAEAPYADAVRRAGEFLDQLQTRIPSLRPSRIAPTSDGAVAVSFTTEEVRCSVEFHDGETCAVIANYNSVPMVFEIEGACDIPFVLEHVAGALGLRGQKP